MAASEQADLDATRAAIADRALIATASAYLTTDVAMSLPFDALGPFKALLRRFFSSEAWSDDDATALSDLVTPHVGDGWWEHDLGSGITLAHGVRHGRYRLSVAGATQPITSIFDRAFEGLVVPEPTPHPRKVKFSTGGSPAPGTWYRRTDVDRPDDWRTRRVFAEPDVTDVMVAGDFVTIGLARTSSWEQRLEPILALVTELFSGDAPAAVPERTRDELMEAAGNGSMTSRPDELHLLDPDEPTHRQILQSATSASDPRVRRTAVAILAESVDPATRLEAVTLGYADTSRVVRRTAIDAADAADTPIRPVFEEALTDEDPWIRWKAVRALAEMPGDSSHSAVAALADDPDFQVRFEVAKSLRGEASD